MKKIKLSELNSEKDMIWLEDPTKFEYVRESTYLCASKNFKPLKKSEGKLIGYEKLVKKKDGSNGVYCGVYYWLKTHDRGMPNAIQGYGNPDKPKNFHPTEAVKFTE